MRLTNVHRPLDALAPSLESVLDDVSEVRIDDRPGVERSEEEVLFSLDGSQSVRSAYALLEVEFGCENYAKPYFVAFWRFLMGMSRIEEADRYVRTENPKVCRN